MSGRPRWQHDILLSGLKEFVYKSDGERSIVALKHEVARRLRRDAGPIGVQFEESGVGESQGNAVVERAICADHTKGNFRRLRRR